MSAVLDHASALERMLLRHKVTVFGYERNGRHAIVRFVMRERKLRLVVEMPDYNAEKYLLTDAGRYERTQTARDRLYWKDVNDLWQAMIVLIEAKLSGIEAGITSFDDEFRQFADAEALLGAGNAD